MSRLLLTAIVTLLTLLACITSTYAQNSEELLQVHFIDVGTGDCIWIHTGDDGIDGNGRMEGYNIIIDGGDWGRFGRVNGYNTISEYLGQSDRLWSGYTNWSTGRVSLERLMLKLSW